MAITDKLAVLQWNNSLFSLYFWTLHWFHAFLCELIQAILRKPMFLYYTLLFALLVSLQTIGYYWKTSSNSMK